MPEIECCCTIYLFFFCCFLVGGMINTIYIFCFLFFLRKQSHFQAQHKRQHSLEDTFTPSGSNNKKLHFCLPLTIHNLKHLCLLGNSFAQFILRNNLLFKSFFLSDFFFSFLSHFALSIKSFLSLCMKD